MLVVFFFQSSIAREIARRKECTPENERKDDGVLDAKRFCVRAVAVDDDVDDDVEQPSDDATRLDDDTKKFLDARRMLVVVFARARVQQRRRFVVRVFL